jgi:hypothetical protein
MKNNLDMIIKYFDYLVKDYNFSILEKEYDLSMMGNAYVIFKSAKTGIEVVIDRGTVTISIGEVIDPIDKWFELTDILDYFAPLEENSYIEIEKQSTIDPDQAIEIKLEKVAILTKEYCKPLLEGNFEAKDKIKAIEKKRVNEMLNKFKNLSKQ